MKQILDFLGKEVDFLIGLKVWQILCVGLGLVFVTIIIIVYFAKENREKNNAKLEKDLDKTSVKKRDDESLSDTQLFVDRSEELESESFESRVEEKEEAVSVAVAVEQEKEIKKEIEQEDERKEEEEIEQEKEEVKHEERIETTVKGKYVIQKQASGLYTFSLLANNGTVLFESEEYSTHISCKNAINTFRKYIKEDAFKINKTEFGDYTYVIKRPNGVYQGKVYNSEQSAKAATISIQKFYLSDNIVLVQKR